jgi:hypothetical protein
MPPWITAFLVLVIVCSLGAYIVTEGFSTSSSSSPSTTSSTACKQKYQTCRKECKETDSACFTKCSAKATECFSNAVAAATIVNTGSLQGPYNNAALRWAAENGLLGNGSNISSNGYMYWTQRSGSTTSIPTYQTYMSGRFGSPSPSSSPSPTPSKTPSPSPSPTATPSPPSKPNAWDRNRNRYSSGWPDQEPNVDGSYDPSLPFEGAYVVQIKKWKPHEIPTEPSPGVTINAPTDEGTEASEIISSSYPKESLQQLIREDVSETIDDIFTNQYEIKYS